MNVRMFSDKHQGFGYAAGLQNLGMMIESFE
jgi:hypothetical protein